jgi:hypothetical protein
MRKLIIFLLFSSFSLFGQNSLINSNTFGFRTSSSFVFFDTSDSSFLEAVRKINPKVLSFPGGLGNFFHLHNPGYGFNLTEVSNNHTGSKPKVAATFNRITKQKSHNRNYIYDFIDLAKNFDTGVIYNANVLTSDSLEILEVIKVFKDNDIDLLGVELGGELTNRTYKHVIDEQIYIQDVSLIAEAITRKHPDLKLIAVAAPVNSIKRHTLWNEKLSDADFYDGVITHSYAKVTKGQDAFGKMIIEYKEGENNFEAFQLYKERAINYIFIEYPNEIKEYLNVFEDKFIWVTEWNLQMSKITANTMLQALFASNYLLELNVNPILRNIELATYHNLAGRTTSGCMILSKNNKTSYLLPFDVMGLISPIFDEKYSISRNKMSDQCFEYNLSLGKYKCIINWSENPRNINLNSVKKYQIEELFSEYLYSKGNTDEVTLNKFYFSNKKKIEVKARSITVIKEL